MKKFYIASKLENHEQVKELKAHLEEAGWVHTYDWTKHGAVRHLGALVMQEVAHKEVEGVREADVVIVLLKGGRGTHIECGVAIVGVDSQQLWIVSQDPEKDFGTGEETCAFYHHRKVRQVHGPVVMKSLAEMLVAEAK